MKSPDIVDTIILVRLRSIAVINLTDSLIAVLLQVGSICEIADNPGKRIAQVNPRSDYWQV